MISHDLAMQLHDRTTRSESLSAEEQALLDQGYALEDGAEDNLLRVNTDDSPVAGLQAQDDAALQQLLTVTKRIQEIAAENEALRRKTADLRRQPTSLQPA